jgi:hypothetical protein
MHATTNASAGLCLESLQATTKASSQAEKTKRSAIMKSPSLVDWYHILRAHHQWTVFQAIRYALWLAR